MQWSRAVGFAAVVACFALAAAACDTIESIAVSGADFGGATADAHCDRRYTTGPSQPSAFCQEITATVAASQFTDDCRNQHGADPGPGPCPRARVIAGCKLDKKNDDGSLVWDWFYDVSDLVAEAGPDAGWDGAGPFAEPVPHTIQDVAQQCADRTRYDQGAELALP